MKHSRSELLDMILMLVLDDLSSKKIRISEAQPRDISITKMLVSCTPSVIADYILTLVKSINDYTYGGSDASDATFKEEKQQIRILVLKSFVGKSFTLTANQAMQVLHAFRTNRMRYDATILDWPLEGLLKTVRQSFTDVSLSHDVYNEVLALKRDLIKFNPSDKSATKILALIDSLISQ